MISKKIMLVGLIVVCSFINTKIANSSEIKTKDVKVVYIKLQQSPKDSALKLEGVIKTQLKEGWDYHSYINVESGITQTKMLIFKKH
ncbi:hypothetical protein WNY51_18400 [Pseudocolwellia sp. AS88]